MSSRSAATAGFFRIFTIPPARRSSLQDMTLANGLVTDEGGALHNLGNLTLRRVALMNNHVFSGDANGYGGAIINQDPVCCGHFDSTFAGNGVESGGFDPYDAFGGAILNNATLEVRNSTFNGNASSASGTAQGGAIWSQLGTATISNSTIAGNTAPTGANLYNAPTGTIKLQSTIVADPIGGANCAGAGPFLTQGYNLADADIFSCGLDVNSSSHFDRFADPDLGPLAFNGGPTQTMLPSVTSPAIDWGVAASGPSDQRGFARPVDLSGFPNAPGGDGTDIGVVEHGDSDSDGIADLADNCSAASNSGQQDTDGDSRGDACDDDDGDGTLDVTDNCVGNPNPGQQDIDTDGSGDACDADDDGDGVADPSDNCAAASNPGQADIDSDGSGDACDSSDDRAPPDGGGAGGGATTTCTVPAIQRGSRVGAVRTALETAHCTLGKKTRKFSAKVKKGRLIKMKAKPGTLLAAGAAVDVVFSKGPKPD